VAAAWPLVALAGPSLGQVQQDERAHARAPSLQLAIATPWRPSSCAQDSRIQSRIVLAVALPFPRLGRRLVRLLEGSLLCWPLLVFSSLLLLARDRRRRGEHVESAIQTDCAACAHLLMLPFSDHYGRVSALLQRQQDRRSDRVAPLGAVVLHCAVPTRAIPSTAALDKQQHQERDTAPLTEQAEWVERWASRIMVAIDSAPQTTASVDCSCSRGSLERWSAGCEPSSPEL
jgi:hypothetical protein